MPWLFLVIAGLLEVGWAIGLKYTVGWTRLWPSAVTLVLMGFSFYFLSLAVRSVPIGTAYALWTGMGAVGAALMGMAFFGEPCNVWRLLFLIMIVVGIAGLKFT